MGKYVVFDGMDGSGKGTQLGLLKGKFGSGAIFTREPGGTPHAEKVRELLLAKQSTPLNDFMLFWAARDDLVEHVVGPALASGKHVFSDRSDSSTFAFQICGEEREDLFRPFFVMRELVFGAPGRRAPDLYLVFDLPATIARARSADDQARKETHFDVRSLDYHNRVRDGFRRFSRCFLDVTFIDADRPMNIVHKDVLAELERHGIVPDTTGPP